METTLAALRDQYPTWIIRDRPRPSATCTQELSIFERRTCPRLDRNLWADDLTELAALLAEQQQLREQF